MKSLILFLGFMGVLGWIGHEDYKTAKIEEAAATCQYQNNLTIPTYSQCIDNQFENNGDR